MKICALPTGNSIRPSAPESEFIDDWSQLTMLVLSVNGKPRAYTSYGSGAGYSVGQIFRYGEAIFNSGRRIDGPVEVIGIRHQDGTTEGEIPTKKVPHWVAK